MNGTRDEDELRPATEDSQPRVSSGRRLNTFLKNVPSSASFSVFFKQAVQFFTTNLCEKMSVQSPVLGFELTTF